MTPTFRQRYGKLTIEELVKDWHPVEVTHAPWAKFPQKEFLQWCRNYPILPFGATFQTPNSLAPVPYLISQAHRMWLTTELVWERIQKHGHKSLLDLGSYPYYVPLILRDFFGWKGKITVTTNLNPTPQTMEFLAKKSITSAMLDLDPYVSDPKDRGSLPTTLQDKTDRFDLILSSHVIEHLYHPRSMLAECAALLKSGGDLIVTTDNGTMLAVYMNFISGAGHTFEPVEDTAAMKYDFWRGHVRFFTERDLKTMVESVGLAHERTDFSEVFYDVLFDGLQKDPVPKLGEFKVKMLEETPWLMNEIAVLARKPG